MKAPQLAPRCANRGVSPPLELRLPPPVRSQREHSPPPPNPMPRRINIFPLFSRFFSALS